MTPKKLIGGGYEYLFIFLKICIEICAMSGIHFNRLKQRKKMKKRMNKANEIEILKIIRYDYFIHEFIAVYFLYMYMFGIFYNLKKLMATIIPSYNQCYKPNL